MLAAFLLLSLLPEGKPVQYTEYDGYHVHNGNITEGDKLCFAFRDLPSVEKTLAKSQPPNMGKVIEDNSFETQLAVAYIRRGDAVWRFKVESLTAEGEALTLRFRSTSSEHGNGSFACPLVVSLPKGPYKTVIFVDNGQEVGKARFEAAP